MGLIHFQALSFDVNAVGARCAHYGCVTTTTESTTLIARIHPAGPRRLSSRPLGPAAACDLPLSHPIPSGEAEFPDPSRCLGKFDRD